MPKPAKPKKSNRGDKPISLSAKTLEIIMLNRIELGSPKEGDSEEKFHEITKNLSEVEKELFKKRIKGKLNKNG